MEEPSVVVVVVVLDPVVLSVVVDVVVVHSGLQGKVPPVIVTFPVGCCLAQTVVCVLGSRNSDISMPVQQSIQNTPSWFRL